MKVWLRGSRGGIQTYVDPLDPQKHADATHQPLRIFPLQRADPEVGSGA